MIVFALDYNRMLNNVNYGSFTTAVAAAAAAIAGQWNGVRSLSASQHEKTAADRRRRRRRLRLANTSPALEFRCECAGTHFLKQELFVLYCVLVPRPSPIN